MRKAQKSGRLDPIDKQINLNNAEAQMPAFCNTGRRRCVAFSPNVRQQILLLSESRKADVMARLRMARIRLTFCTCNRTRFPRDTDVAQCLTSYVLTPCEFVVAFCLISSVGLMFKPTLTEDSNAAAPVLLSSQNRLKYFWPAART